MTGFERGADGRLTCDGLLLSDLAERFGTPLYVYSWNRIEERFRSFDSAFAAVAHLVCYAAKANSSLAILKRLAALGSGADVVSGGELRLAMESGIPAEKIVFSGVGKTEDELALGISSGILAFNAESEREIERIEGVAARLGKTARVALRVNPDIDARSHPYISTGLKHNKFGVDIARAPGIFEKASRMTHVRMTGIQAHIGSQILEAGPLSESARALAALARRLASAGASLETIDVGGGLGIGDGALTPDEYAAAALPALSGLPQRILIEPGRAIAGPAGVLLTRVVDVKQERGKTFVVADAGMNDLLRPALYEAIHAIERVDAKTEPKTRADVVGPVCETADAFAQDLDMVCPQEGDLLAIRDAGAYGFVMSSNYNMRLRAAEVLVADGAAKLARRRETFEDFIRLEQS